MLTGYGNRHLVVHGFSISFLLYYSMHVYMNISPLQGGGIMPVRIVLIWMCVMLGCLVYVVVMINNPAHWESSLGPLVCCM